MIERCLLYYYYNKKNKDNKTIYDFGWNCNKASESDLAPRRRKVMNVPHVKK